MKFLKSFLLFLIILIVSCQSYLPFSSRKEKRTNIELIKSKINITNSEFNMIKDKDSILYETSMAIKDTVEISNIKRRLDSFFKGNYNEKELYLTLKSERLKTGWDFEIIRNHAKGKDLMKLDSISQIQEIIKNFEKNMKLQVDTTMVKSN